MMRNIWTRVCKPWKRPRPNWKTITAFLEIALSWEAFRKVVPLPCWQPITGAVAVAVVLVALSGWLTRTAEETTHWTNKETPLVWSQGKFDDKVLYEQQAFGLQKLDEASIKNVQSETYPMGHESDPKELAAMAQFLDTLFFDGNDDSDKKGAASDL